MGDRERITPSFRYLIVVCIMSAVLMSILNVVYTNWVDQKNRNSWCDLLTLIDTQGNSTPTQNRTPAQVEYFRLIRELKQAQGCK